MFWLIHFLLVVLPDTILYYFRFITFVSLIPMPQHIIVWGIYLLHYLSLRGLLPRVKWRSSTLPVWVQVSLDSPVSTLSCTPDNIKAAYLASYWRWDSIDIRCQWVEEARHSRPTSQLQVNHAWSPQYSIFNKIQSPCMPLVHIISWNMIRSWTHQITD